MDNEKKIKGYKGFNPDLTCRDFQYEVGKEYQTDKAKTCETGFHFCENPFDVLNYYSFCNERGQLNRFCEIEGSGDIDNSHSDKIACSHIKVNAEIGLQGIINAGVKFIMDKVSRSGSKQSNDGLLCALCDDGQLCALRDDGRLCAICDDGRLCALCDDGQVCALRRKRARGNRRLARNGQRGERQFRLLDSTRGI